MRLVGIAITIGGLSGTAHADAKALVAEAEALAAKGDMLGAGAKFRAAYKLEPVPEHICNSGVAYHRASDLPRAHRYLNQCVTMGSSLDPTYRDQLRKVVDSIEAKLAAGDFTPIDLSLDPLAAIATFDAGKPYDDEIVGGGRLWIPYGTYKLVVRADGYIDKPVDVTASSDAAIPMRVTLEKKPIEVIEPPPPPPLAGPVYVDVPPPSRVPAFIASGATVALGAAGLVFWFQARGKSDDAAAATERAEYDRLHGEAHDKQRIAIVFGGLAGVAAIASGYLWWRDIRAPRRRLEMAVTATGVTVFGRF